MRLEEITAPVGPEPIGVYWRRRLIAVASVIVLLYLFSNLGDSPKKHPAASTGVTSPSTAPKLPGASAAPSTGPCESGDVTVSADANGADYPAGVNPKIVITVKNVSNHVCNLDTSKRYLTISSGGDLWWSSAACASGTSAPVTLAVSQQVTSSYTWNRKRQVNSCTQGGTAPGGTYLAQAHLDTIVTPGAVIRLH